mmetsp:Transcript_77457/g.90257  ORF Transcript_77457/g.90257 Transcript_77457/m.90257 type:complete len:166 (+) Transcript_77457:405-902(+)
MATVSMGRSYTTPSMTTWQMVSFSCLPCWTKARTPRGSYRPVRCSTLIWPLFYEGHYVLLVVDMKRKELECYDSLRSYAHTQRSNTLAVVRALITSAVKSNVKKEVYKGCQQQERGSNDCGIHVINNALAVMCPGTNMGHDRRTLRKLVRESDEESWDINPYDYE